ncbi:MAG: hypothetical protein R2816_02870 [Flavobacteriaceae bacterium]|nr:hypothetical protein [Flavobacteriaceae bacterium]
MGYIIIGIIIFIAFLFFRDKQDEVTKIQSQGGFELKYGTLIHHFLSIPRMQVERRSKSSITMLVKDPAVITRFTISHGFEDVSIFWEHKSLTFGEHKLNWRFPEGMSQNTMISVIEDELGEYERNLISS